MNKLFICLTYDEEINNQKIIINNHSEIILKDYVSFVALKNGMHNEKGFIYFNHFEKNKKIKIRKYKTIKF